MQDKYMADDAGDSKIAIIGMALRFPGADTIEQYWYNLEHGIESISTFTDAELRASGIDEEKIRNPDYVKAGGVLEGIDLFDASFFGYAPREAALMDPQQRLFLECSWEALEQAGYNPDTYRGRIGIYAGSSSNTYLIYNLCSSPELIDPEYVHATLLANDKDHLATRVAYKCNLKGPCVTIQTTCSTSLVATHMACQSLLNGEADIMLAGGATIRVPQRVGYLYQPSGILSPDGHCRAFDATSQGTVVGNGLGVVVLKRLADALADRDHIYAVILGSAINNDGSLKAGYTAPSEEGQAAGVAEALAVSGVEPDTITYIEAHGTGTAIGDPIEIAALTQVYGSDTSAPGSCLIGTVKTNLGHLDAAAGVAGLIKTALSLKRQVIPPTLHFQQPNPHIDFHHTPFAVNTHRREWKTKGTPRRAGVTSLGIGGTNAHVIVEEPPALLLQTTSTSWQLLPLSARSPAALERMTTSLAAHLDEHAELGLADVAYTLQVGRRPFAYRRYLVCQDRQDAISVLKSRNPERLLTETSTFATPAIAFLFPGQGSQYIHMARDLYTHFPTFQHHFQTCASYLERFEGIHLFEVLYPTDDQREDAIQQLIRTDISQLALFTVEYALAQLWMSWGVQPQAMLGHSIGEYVAACLAGVFSLEDALSLVAARGRVMQSMPQGAMLAVALSEHDIQPLLGHDLSLAAVNGPTSCVVSGPTEAILTLQERLSGRDITCQRLHTSHAFHSQMMEPALGSFMQRIQTLSLKQPNKPYLSNVSGSWITAAEAIDPAYWVTHLRSTVRFSEGIEELAKQHLTIFLEVGPGHTLSTLLKRHPAIASDRGIMASMRHPQKLVADDAFILHTVGRLWQHGVPFQWEQLHAPIQRARVPLPTYSFDRQRYWIEPRTSARQDTVPMTTFILPSQPLPTRSDQHRDYIGPRNDNERRLIVLWQELLGVESIGIYDDFFELGGDSFIGVTLISQIQKTFQVPVLMQHLIEASTIARQAALISTLLERGATRSTPGTSPLVTLKAGGTRRPLFLVHPSGGTVLGYRDLARCLDDNQPLYGLQAMAPGVGPNYEIIEEVAAYYLESIRQIQVHGPYRLGGWSYGGTVAFEMARQLHVQNEETELLALFDSHPPISYHSPMPENAAFLTAFPWVLRLLLGEKGPLFTYEELQQYPLERQLDFVFEQINAARLFVFETNAEELRQYFHMWEINNLSLRRYDPPLRSYPGPMTLFLASESLPPPLLDLLKINLTDQLATTGWERLLSRPLQVYQVPANHYTLLNNPAVQKLARVLNQHLRPLEITKANS